MLITAMEYPKSTATIDNHPDVKLGTSVGDSMCSQLVAQPLHGVTAKQAEVLLWTARGKTNKEIAAILGISTISVKLRLTNARRTLQATNSFELLSKSFLLGILAPAEKSS